MLSEWAVFQVNINSVLGSGVKNSEDALKIAHRAVELGFTSTVGIIHDHDGQLKPLGQSDQEIFEEIMTLGKRSFSRFNDFQHSVANGREHDWRCRAGRGICTFVKMAWCTGARSSAATPAFRWKNTRRRCAIANSTRTRIALPGVPCPACNKWEYWTTGGPDRSWNRWRRVGRAIWCKLANENAQE